MWHSYWVCVCVKTDKAEAPEHPRLPRCSRLILCCISLCKSVYTHSWQWGPCSCWCLSPHHWRPDRGRNHDPPPRRVWWVESHWSWSGYVPSEARGGTAVGSQYRLERESTTGKRFRIHSFICHLCTNKLFRHKGILVYDIISGYAFCEQLIYNIDQQNRQNRRNVNRLILKERWIMYLELL